jgi:methionine sulfoxide reductase heme-binding subunit
MTPLWTTSRASGIAALVTASLAVSCGLLLALRLPIVRRHFAELRGAHQTLANATFALIGVHAVALLFDPVLKPGLVGLLVPFAAPYRPVATALGQVAAFGILGLGATFYVRRRIGTARWRSAHRWLPVFWALAVAHGLLVGSDATAVWSLAATLPPIAVATALAVTRYARLGAPAGSAASAASRSAGLNSGSSREPAR